MLEPVYLGFDFGLKRIGIAVGQRLTGRATSLGMLLARDGVPAWEQVQKLINEWRPHALVVGVPTCLDGSRLPTTRRARAFAVQLHTHFGLVVHAVDERLSTVEARGQLFVEGGYRKIKSTSVDGLAACIILEQWLHETTP